MGFVVILAALLGLALLDPNLLGEPDNYIPANPMVTPPHIVPEWYFLFAYAVLRSIPNKLGGVIGLFGSLLILLILPFIHSNSIKGNAFYPPAKVLFWLFVVTFCLLTLMGGCDVSDPFPLVRRRFSALYFFYFLGLTPLRTLWDKVLT